MLTANSKWLYFGCKNQPGHHLYVEGMVSNYENKFRKLSNFDSQLPPQDRATPYIASFSRLSGWGMSAIAFWDYSVDSRGGCNSVVFVDSLTVDPQTMLLEAEKRFPQVFNRLPQKVVYHDAVAPDV